MEIELSTMFLALQDTVKSILTQKKVAVLEAMEEVAGVGNYSIEVTSFIQTWQRLRDMGVAGFSIPLEQGGYELGEAVVTMLCEEMGATAFYHPYLHTLFVADILCHLPDQVKHQHELKKIAEGKQLFVLLSLEADSYTAVDSGYLIHSNMQYLVPDLAQVSSVLLLVDESIYKIPLTKAGLLIANPTNDTRSSGKILRLQQMELSSEELVNIGIPAYEHILAKAKLRQAAFLLGLARGSLGLAVNYSNKRKQFARKLIDNQAVSFKLAALYAELQALKLKVQSTASLEENGKSIVQAANEALASTAEFALKVSREALHLHGAFGMTQFASIQSYYRLISYEAVKFGTPNSLWLAASKANRAEQ